MTRDTRARLAIAAVVAALTWIESAHADLATRFTHYSVEHGLSQAAVEAIAQDRRGFIWLGTDEGLNRFDGYRFVTYVNDPNVSTTLAHNWVWALHVDAHGAVWVGTDGGGLDRLDPAYRRVRTSARWSRIPPPTSWCAQSSRSRPARCGSARTATDCFDSSRRRVTSAASATTASDDTSLSNDHVKALHIDASGYLWIGTDGGGVNRLKLGDNTLERYALDRHDAGAWTRARIRSIVSDPKNGTLWIGSYEDGLIRLDPASHEVRTYRHHADDPASLSADSIRILFNDEAGALWIGTDGGGLNRYDPAADAFEHVRQDPADFHSLSDDHVVSLFQDRGGVMWVGTYVGVNTWNPRIGTFATVARRNGGPNELTNNYVTSFAKAQEGPLWIGTSGGGLNRMDPATGAIDALRHSAKNAASLGDDRVFSLAAEPPNGLWIGTRSGGLNRLDLDDRPLPTIRPRRRHPRLVELRRRDVAAARRRRHVVGRHVPRRLEPARPRDDDVPPLSPRRRRSDQPVFRSRRGDGGRSRWRAWSSGLTAAASACYDTALGTSSLLIDTIRPIRPASRATTPGRCTSTTPTTYGSAPKTAG